MQNPLDPSWQPRRRPSESHAMPKWLYVIVFISMVVALKGILAALHY